MELARVFLCVLSVFVALVSERLVVLASFSQSLDSDFTFTLPAGRKECFYQTMKKDASLEIEYQVIKTHITGIILYEIVTLVEQTALSACSLLNHDSPQPRVSVDITLHLSHLLLSPFILVTVHVFCMLWFLFTLNIYANHTGMLLR